jgi:hypothetical protein
MITYTASVTRRMDFWIATSSHGIVCMPTSMLLHPERVCSPFQRMSINVSIIQISYPDHSDLPRIRRFVGA